MSTETQFQAAIGAMLLAEISCYNISIALKHFNNTIDPRITGWELYRDGKLKYTYDRVHDRLIPFGCSHENSRITIEAYEYMISA